MIESLVDVFLAAYEMVSSELLRQTVSVIACGLIINSMASGENEELIQI